jgi:predicted dehydrogenase
MALVGGHIRAWAQTPKTKEVRVITLDPGHFHAALIQQEMYPGVSKEAAVYAPLGPDLVAHLNRIARYNTRAENPTNWQLKIYAGPDFLERMLKERPGNVVVISGRNRNKIDMIKACVENGLNVFADKPWIINSADFEKLKSTLNTAESKGVVALDLMTVRYDATSILQREFVNDPALFGTASPGTEQEPGVEMESVHHIKKLVAGVPNLRPSWFFDINQQGEGLTDVGTHLVDLVPYILFPDQPLDYRTDIKMIAAKRWPTILTREEFSQVTGEPGFPDFLSAAIRDNRLEYACNDLISYTLRGIHVRLKVMWNYVAPEGSGDTSISIFRGSKSRVAVLQGKAQNFVPELYVVPNSPSLKEEVLRALAKKVATLQGKFPGIAVESQSNDLHVKIPDQYRMGDEQSYARLTQKLLEYVKNSTSPPSYEKPNMLAKYYVTTKGVELGRLGK